MTRHIVVNVSICVVLLAVACSKDGQEQGDFSQTRDAEDATATSVPPVPEDNLVDTALRGGSHGSNFRYQRAPPVAGAG